MGCSSITSINLSVKYMNRRYELIDALKAEVSFASNFSINLLPFLSSSIFERRVDVVLVSGVKACKTVFKCFLDGKSSRMTA